MDCRLSRTRSSKYSVPRTKKSPKLKVLHFTQSKSSNLIVIRVSGCVSVIRAQYKLLHDALDARVYIPSHVAGAQVPSDEFVRYRNDVAIVRGQAEPEDGKLVPLQRVLEKQ